MKCEHCGANLTLEEENCPFCGQPNPHARQHIRDMRRYQNEFEDAKEHVYKSTKLYTQIVVRVGILAVLAILSVVLFVLADNAYSFMRDREEKRSAKNYEEYSRILDGYLEEENFRAFEIFCEEHVLRSYDDPYAPKYGKIISVSRSYVYLMDYLWRYAYPLSYTTIQQAELVSDGLENFYRELNEEWAALYGVATVQDEKVTAAMEKMEENVRDFLYIYCGFTREEADSIPELSKAKRMLLLEEKLEGRLSDEE